MWNQKFPAATYENDPHERFKRGVPPSSSADWGWIQHMAGSLKEGGRMAVVLDTGAVSRGSGNQGSNKERDIRKAFVDADLVEAVVLLPENLFYNTTAPGIILALNTRKRQKGEILLINASKLFSKGRPKNYLEEQHIRQIGQVFHEWRTEPGLSAVVCMAQVVKNDFNLSPSRYVATDETEEVLPLEEAVVLLQEAEEEGVEADRELQEVLEELGFGGRQMAGEPWIEDVEHEVSGLDASWASVELGEIADLNLGQSPPSEFYNDEGVGLPFLQGKAEFGDIYPKPTKWCSRPLKVGKNGSVLVSVRAPVGDVNLAHVWGPST